MVIAHSEMIWLNCINLPLHIYQSKNTHGVCPDYNMEDALLLNMIREIAENTA